MTKIQWPNKRETCVVPCGKQQKTASTVEKSASLIEIMSGKSYKYKKSIILIIEIKRT